MSDNVLQTLQKLVQDVLAPDVRELKVRLESLSNETKTRFAAVEKQIGSLSSETETRFAAMEKQIASLSKENEAQYKGILSAISELKAQSELNTLSAVYELRERIAVLEPRAA